jgi:transposase
VAVTAPAEPVTVSAPARTTPDKAAARIEIALPDGTVVRVDEAVGSAALRRVMAAVRA